LRRVSDRVDHNEIEDEGGNEPLEFATVISSWLCCGQLNKGDYFLGAIFTSQSQYLSTLQLA
jgi:hypothetical protein